MNMSEKRGFFGSLFDLSFTEFVTTRIIKFLFVLAIIGSAIGALAIVIARFSSGAAGISVLLLSLVVFFLSVLFSRIWLELIIVLFRIAENTSRLVEQNKTE
jgi:signal transduction histidine kinase